MIEALGAPVARRSGSGSSPDSRDAVVPLLQAAREALAGRAAADAAVRQDEKADAIGHLVGGLAHDFNNLLGVIVGNLDRASRLTSAEATAFRYIVDALTATDRAAVLVRRLLAFVRPQPMLPILVDVDRLLIDLKPLLDVATPGCVVTLHLGRVGDCLIDANQLENAVLNLAVNAHHAMPDGGMLAIATRTATREGIEPDGTRTSRDFVVLDIRDTGTGMSPEVRAKAGERFFTTKGDGRGTGLGLAQVLAFADQCGGSMQLTSEIGQGTCVTLYIPRAGHVPE